MLSWLFGNREGTRKNEALPSYEESREIADKGSAEKREWLASQVGLQPEFLYYFATDPVTTVRLAVAGNLDTPLQADAILAKDESEEVRREVAAKVSRLMPGLDTKRADKVTEMVLEIIEVLANDQAANVRKIVAREIKSLDNVPESVVAQLAWDAETEVAMPILEYSPLLSERHLLEILRSGIDGGALAAIARRHKLTAPVSARVVSCHDENATSDLVANKTAQIDEETFLDVGDMASRSTKVCNNLIERDDLTLSTIRRVATFVGNAVIDRILERNKKRLKLDDEVVRDIRESVTEQIVKGAADSKSLPGEEARARAEKLFADDKLNDKAFTKAIDKGERWFIIHALALLTGFEWEKIRDALNSKSGKSVVAVSWKAGLKAETSLSIQTKVASLTGKALIRPKKDGDYAMSQDDMEWYLDFFG